MMKKIKRLAMVPLLLSVLLLGCDSERYAAEEKFAAVQKKLMMSVNDLTKIPPQVELANEPYIKGNIAVFKQNGVSQVMGKKGNNGTDNVYSMDNYYFHEMGESYAVAPEEVGTIALLDCRMVDKGVYRTNHGREYRAKTEDCELTMIDRAKAAVILRKKFEKTRSAESKAYGNSILQQISAADILQYLKGLPGK